VNAGAAHDPVALYNDPHLHAREFFRAVEGLPGRGFKRVPFVLDGLEWRRPSPAPGLGEHTLEVLQRLAGIDERAYRELEREGVVGSEPAPGTWTSYY
jgi:crotonobetainyl-CoA:carnitine CoA-transferase CaiB-like acyl-CoA transferase